MKQLKIGKIKLKNPLLLAPMVEVTDLAYRDICRKAGAAIAYTEMLHINAVLNENEPTKKLMMTGRKDRPVGIQITGSNVEEFRKVIPYLKGYDLVDINCGCPSSRITDNEAGSALLKDPKKIAKIISILKEAGFVVTAKIRLGYDKNNVLETAKAIEKAGASAITVHARMASHKSSVPADWQWIGKVKEAVNIPVIGNGDIFTGEDAARMLKICDGCMIARGAIGDPLVFDRILHYLETGKQKRFDFRKNMKLFLQYLKLAKKYGIIDLGRVKYLGSNFIRNTEGAARMRNEFMQLKSYEEIVKFIGKASK